MERVIREEGQYIYEYYIKDHLGNTRVVFSDKNKDGCLQPFNNDCGILVGGGEGSPSDYSELLQESHYYPFGMLQEGPWDEREIAPDNKYLYNGKELNEDFGLNWLDYGARWYDPAIARWNAVDPLAESYYPYSPYNYVLNNPLKYIDPLAGVFRNDRWSNVCDFDRIR